MHLGFLISHAPAIIFAFVYTKSQSRDVRYVALDDGRKLCLECLDSSIMDTSECQPLYLDIQEFYEGLNMKIEQQVPLLLVERPALNEAMEGEKHVRPLYKNLHCFITRLIIYLNIFFLQLIFFIPFEKGHHHLPETRGLCLSEEQTVSTVRVLTIKHIYELFLFPDIFQICLSELF